MPTAIRYTRVLCAVVLITGVAAVTESGSAVAAETRSPTQQTQDDVPASDDASLKDLQLSEGPPSPGFMMGALTGTLPEGDVVPAPAFDSATTSYAADVTQEIVTLRLGAAQGATIDVVGTSADGTELTASNQSSVGGDNGAFMSVTLSGLASGENALDVTVTAADETTQQSYTLLVTSAGAPAVVDLTLRDLQLSEGPPSSGFMMSALTGTLPEGDVIPSPVFDPEITSYTMDVAQDTFTVRLRAADGPDIEFTGTSADGSQLAGRDGSRINTADAFVSQTFAGLTPGENTIEVALAAGDEEKRYILVVNYSAAR